MMSSGFSILFVCRHNSVRSQVAALLAHKISHGKVSVASAGPEPLPVPDYIHQWATDTMGAENFDLQSTPLESFSDATFDLIITLCDTSHQALPELPSDHEHIRWNFQHPDTSEALSHLEIELAERLRLLLLAKKLI